MRKDRGFTLVEVVIALSLLSVALLGLALAIPLAVQANGRNRVDSEAGMLAQRELEQMIAQPVTVSSFLDVAGNTVSLSPGGCSLSGGRIQFSTTAPAGYSAVVNGTSGGRYELRWTVVSLSNGVRQLTVAARRLGPQRSLFPPVQLSAMQGR